MEDVEVNEVAADQEGAECRGWPRREDEDEGDVEQDEVPEVDEDCESRFESVSDFKDTTRVGGSYFRKNESLFPENDSFISGKMNHYSRKNESFNSGKMIHYSRKNESFISGK